MAFSPIEREVTTVSMFGPAACLPVREKISQSHRQINPVEAHNTLSYLAGFDANSAAFTKKQLETIVKIERRLRPTSFGNCMSSVTTCFPPSLSCEAQTISCTPISCLAVAWGFSLGSFSGLTTFMPSSTFVTLLASCCSGTANGGGTFLSIVDANRRSEAENDLQDFDEEVLALYEELGRYLIVEFCTAKKSSDSNSGKMQLMQDLAKEIYMRKDLIIDALKIGISNLQPFQGDKITSEQVFKPLLEAVEYVRSGILPTHTSLRNEINTILSPSWDEYRLLAKGLAACQKENKELKAHVDFLLSALKASNIKDQTQI